MKTNTGLYICTFLRALQIDGRLDHRLTWAAWGAEIEIHRQDLQ